MAVPNEPPGTSLHSARPLCSLRATHTMDGGGTSARFNTKKLRNPVAACYVGNLDEQVTEDLLYELFTQVGRVVDVRIPKVKQSGDRVNRYAFVEFQSEKDVGYAEKILNMIPLYGRGLKVSPATVRQDKKNSIGALLHIGNLAPEVNEKLLYDTFSSFGSIDQAPSFSYDSVTGKSKGFAFIGFTSFAASDAAIKYMHGQLMCNKALTVQYAYRKGGKGERHGSEAERLLASKMEEKASIEPNLLHLGGQPSVTPPPLMHTPVGGMHQQPPPMMMGGGFPGYNDANVMAGMPPPNFPFQTHAGGAVPLFQQTPAPF